MPRATTKSAPLRNPRTSPGRDRLDLGPLPEFVGFHIRIAQVAVYADFMVGQAPSPLTPGLLAILVLIDRNPELTQQRLCEAIGVDKSTMVASLHRLSDRGLIKRVRSTEDRRQNSLVLTAKGVAKLKATLQHVRMHEKRISSRLSAAECEQLVGLLRKIG